VDLLGGLSHAGCPSWRDHRKSVLGDPTASVDLARLIPSWIQAKVSPYADDTDIGQRDQRADTGSRHQASDRLILARQPHEATGEDADLPADLLQRCQEGLNSILQRPIATSSRTRSMKG
jgi:hypothetical protein